MENNFNLSGKCLEHFTNYMLKGNLTKYEYQGVAKGFLCDSTVYSHILCFFDSMGIYVFPLINFQFGYEIHVDGEQEPYIGLDFNNRIEATIEGIKEANNIYNRIY